MNEITTSGFLIELDCLLDTRLATIDLIDDTKTIEIVKDGYIHRDKDVFKGIDTDVFNARYKDRDLHTLRNAITTPMVKILNEFAVKTLKTSISSPHHNKPKIILNIHPYQLDDDTRVLFIDMLRFITDNLADIEIIDYTYKQLTPEYMKDNVSIAAMYHYYEWLEIQSTTNGFDHITCPDVSILVPMIYFIDADNHTGLDPFESMVKLMEPLVGLKMLSSYYFSANFDGHD